MQVAVVWQVICCQGLLWQGKHAADDRRQLAFAADEEGGPTAPVNGAPPNLAAGAPATGTEVEYDIIKN